MIDPRVFAEQMSMLGERFNRQVSKPVIQGYYQALSNQLTTEQFVIAAQRIFNESVFWPAPAEFVDKAKGQVEDAAQLEWMEVVAAIADNRPFRGVTESGRAALKSVGGSWAIKNGANLSGIRRDFMAAYIATERRARREQAAPALASGELRALAEGVVRERL